MIFKGKITKKQAEELMDNSERVLQFVADVKWQKGFSCRQCGNTNYCDGKTPYSRRCTKCKKEESATANTIFHNVKFPVNKAFYIAYNVCVLNKDISSIDFATTLGINQMTCWKFKKRIMDCVSANTSEEGQKPALRKILMSGNK